LKVFHRKLLRISFNSSKRLSGSQRKQFLAQYLLTARGPPRDCLIQVIDKFGNRSQVSIPADSNGKFIGPYSIKDQATRSLLITALGFGKFTELTSYAPYRGQNVR